MIGEFIQPLLHRHTLILMAKLIAVYLVFALPFSSMVLIPGLTNLRPAVALIPIFGIFFGPVGAWGYAFGNLLYDALTGSLMISSTGGFVGNFAAVSLFWLCTRKYYRDGLLMGSVQSVLYYEVAAAAASAIVSVTVMAFVALLRRDLDVLSVGVSIFLNDLVFIIIPGAAICVLLSTILKLKPVLIHEADG